MELDPGDVSSDESGLSLWSFASLEGRPTERGVSGEDFVSECFTDPGSGRFLESSLERGVFTDDAEAGGEAG